MGLPGEAQDSRPPDSALNASGREKKIGSCIDPAEGGHAGASS